MGQLPSCWAVLYISHGLRNGRGCQSRSLHSRTRKIKGSIKQGRLEEMLNFAKIMEHKGMAISQDIAYCLVHECTQLNDLELARKVKSCILYNGLDWITVLADHLIRLFTSCGTLTEANQTFDNVLEPSQYTWNAVISAQAKLGEGRLAFELYGNMQERCLKPDKVTFLVMLKACGNMGALLQGRHIHQCIIENKIEFDVVVGTTIVDMYAKCGIVEEARRIFDKLPGRNVVTWGAMIAGYTQHGKGIYALECFESMQQNGIQPTEVTFSIILKACGGIVAIARGRHIHEQVIESQLQFDFVLGNTLVDMYCKCGELEDATKVFRNLPAPDIIAWGALITGYVQHEKGILALEYFEKMQLHNMKPSKVTFLGALKACGLTCFVEKGRHIHEQIIEDHLQFDTLVGGALVDMYSKCGMFDEAQAIFNKLLHRDVVAWGAIIIGYAEYGEGLPVLECLHNMENEEMHPNQVIYLGLLKGCGCVGAIQQGRFLHAQIIEDNLQSEILIGNTLVDMYAKCGNLEEAHIVFDNLLGRDVVSWGAILAAYAQHGEGLLAVECLQRMQQESIKPNRIILLCVLIACSRAGLVDNGRWYFEHMEEHYDVTPDVEHYNCMVDLLGRAGCLEEAKGLLNEVTVSNFLGWMSLFNACKMHGNVELGKFCFEKVVQLDESFSAGYVLLSNICADAVMSEAAGINRSDISIDSMPFPIYA